MKRWLNFEPCMAEDGGTGGGAPVGAEGNPGGVQPPQKLTFEEISKDESYKADIENLIAESRKAWEADRKKAEEDAKKDPLTLAKQRIAELEAKDAAAELEKHVTGLLAEAKLPSELSRFLAHGDKAAADESVKAFAELWNSAMAVTIKEKMPGYDPKSGGTEEKDPFLAGFNKK